MRMLPKILLLAAAGLCFAQERQPMKPSATTNTQNEDGSYTLRAGTRIPLTLMNSVSSKNAGPGDQIYLETLIPTVVNRQVIVPAGSYVIGSIVESHRPGKVKGKGDLYLKFDSLMLPSGATIDLAGRPANLDGGNPGQLDRTEGKVTSEGSGGRDAAVIAGTTLGGAAMGNWIGGEGRNAGIGAGAGAAAGLGAILLTRGPEAVLQRGSTMEMVLSRDVRITQDDLGSGGAGQGFRPAAPPRPAQPAKPKSNRMTIPHVGRWGGWF